MMQTEIEPSRRSSHAVLAVVRTWWPAPALVAVALIVQGRVLGSRSGVGGHAAEHLDGATAPFMGAVVLSILFWTTPRARRQVDLLAVSALWFAMTVLVMFGNLRVVDDLVAAGYGRTPTGSVPDVADHSLANSSVWFAVGAALLVVMAWWRRRHVGGRATIAAAVTTVIVPPWIIPGAGVIVIGLVRLVRHGKRAPAPTCGVSANPGAA